MYNVKPYMYMIKGERNQRINRIKHTDCISTYDTLTIQL